MSPTQVVQAPGQFEPWQTRAGELNAFGPDNPQYQQILANISPAFGADDPTGGADHFYSPGAQAALGRDTPDWAVGQTGRDIGDHRFYALGYGGDPGASDAQDAAAAQAGGLPAIGQVAQQGGGFDPRLFDALNDPWVPAGDKAVLGALLEQRMKQMFPEHDIPNSYEEYLRASKDPAYAEHLQRNKSGGITVNTGYKVPTGYMEDPDNPGSLLPIPGGPAEEMPGELAARIGLANHFISEAPALREKLKSGAATGLWDRAQAGFNSASEQAVIYRKMQSGADALQRMLTGAGMNNTEAAAYASRYLPTFTDDAASATSKLDQLVAELKSTKEMLMRGRGGTPDEEGWTDMGNGVRIREKP
jgi:hypothetical protein